MPNKGSSSDKPGGRSAGTDNAFSLLQQDHREVETYFDEYEQLKTQEEKEATQ
jgi:hypothetical protein